MPSIICFLRLLDNLAVLEDHLVIRDKLRTWKLGMPVFRCSNVLLLASLSVVDGEYLQFA